MGYSDDIMHLLQKQLTRGPLEEDEQLQLKDWLTRSPYNQQLWENISGENWLEEHLRIYMTYDAENIWEKTLAHRRKAAVRPLFGRGRWIAAAIFLGIAIGAYYWVAFKKQPAPDTIVMNASDIGPGKAGAILTLSDGSQVVLDSLANGVIAAQNGAQAILQNGQLTYKMTGGQATGVTYNTMTTPKGRQFHLILPDGTKAWLNAASTITFPTVFNGKDRQVSVSGEVYLEVTKNAKMPFIVHVNNKTRIAVLGTDFNISAYNDEATVNTTLITGSVRVSEGQSSVLLRPGQQAQISNMKSQRGITVIDRADVEKVTAWKHGAFNFEGMRLEEAMRQLERWYDIEVVYENGIPDVHFWGEIGRDLSLSAVLKILSGTKLKFRIEQNRKLIIMR